MAPLLLGYWDIRGLGQSIKLLLEHAGHEYELKKYTTGVDWFATKGSMPLDFPNLPYIIDGDVKLTQSIAIMRYIARQHDLMPITELEQQRGDLIQAQYSDYLMQTFKVFYDPKFEEMKDELVTAVQGRMAGLSKFLGDHQYFVGSKLTFIDFAIYEFLDKLKIFKGDILDATPNLQSFQARIENLPKIKSYMASDRFLKWPLNGPTAGFGGAGSPSPFK